MDGAAVTVPPLTERLREHRARYGEVSLSAWASQAKHLIAEAAEAVALLEAAEAREKELEAKVKWLEERRRDAPLGGQGSHWAGCSRVHIDCATARYEAAEARAAELERTLESVRLDRRAVRAGPGAGRQAARRDGRG